MEKDEIPEGPAPPEPDTRTEPSPEGSASDVPPEPTPAEGETAKESSGGTSETAGDSLTIERIPDVACECTPTSAGAAVPHFCSTIDDPEPGTSTSSEKDEVTMELRTKPGELDPIREVNSENFQNSEVNTSVSDKITEEIGATLPVKPKTSINSQASVLSMDSSCNELFEKLHMLIKNTVVKDIVNAALCETGSSTPSNRGARIDTSLPSSRLLSKSKPSLIPKPRTPLHKDTTHVEKLQKNPNMKRYSPKATYSRIKQDDSKKVKMIDASSSFSPRKCAPSKPVSKPMSTNSFSAGKARFSTPVTKPVVTKTVPVESQTFSAGKSPFLGFTPKPTDSKKKLQRPVSQAKPKRKEGPREKPMTPPEKLNTLITQMQHIITDNFAKTHWRSQRDNINKLVTNLHEIKTLIDSSFVEKVPSYKDDTCSQTDDIPQYILNKENTSSLKSMKNKNNKVYIKFVQSNDKADKKDSSYRLCELVKLTSEEEEAKIENRIKDADSMDGVFIPTCDPPSNIEEEEEESNGLDITITFPQITRLVSDEAGSKLTVSLSDISEGALKRLKRCPKDFTLHMDFVQGKVQFQSGITLVNNFSIGPDLKFIENPTDDNKSEVINIKPSTECKFTSQQVSLENVERTSHKSLKSTDSELFNVVNLPCIYRNPSLNAVTKSCTTFRSDEVFSVSMAKQLFKSTPQISSLVNIFEDRPFDNANKAASTDKKRKGRNVQKKIITSSTTL